MPISFQSKCQIWFLQLRAKVLLTLGIRKQAVDAFHEILAINPHNLYALNSLGYEGLRNKHFPNALSWFEKAVIIDAQNPNAQFNLAYTLEELGRLPEAEAAFRAAIAWVWSWYGLGG
jgi:tetratricopeptide (TPR) repeat protein